MKNEGTVSYLDFVQEMEKEYEYHSEGGTSYRKETARIALEVTQQAGEFSLFLNHEETNQFVTKQFPDLDEERTKDVVKMLHVIARDLHYQANLSDEIKHILKQKRLNRKPLSFVKR